MLIDTKIAIAVKCGTCDNLNVHETSLFELFTNKTTEIVCTCGQHNAIIKTKNHKSLWMDIDCYVCQDKHTFKYTLKQLLRGNIITRCIETGVEICFIVSCGDVNELIEKYEMNCDGFYKELEFLDYFNNPEIMMKSLERIKELDSSGLLGCSCGENNIEMNIFPDRIELRCMSCEGIKLIYAETNDDYRNFMSKEKIILRENSFECIDAINQNKDTNKK
ncbi:hypothetical protein [Proteiniborus sp. MB09-C3]|uniref:hypothetical protein n=1 Tax=Proteiniborus sp. MB09-C3 TaxID=3050072 RepID=UPI002557C708|nr:hypothetical protein [Proteiniborus sp. MB09-C3]WIV12232.1 hypothetical protein QO263_00485 [Proteiniborus sp. MB09-C3]